METNDSTLDLSLITLRWVDGKWYGFSSPFSQNIGEVYMPRKYPELAYTINCLSGIEDKRYGLVFRQGRLQSADFDGEEVGELTVRRGRLPEGILFGDPCQVEYAYWRLINDVWCACDARGVPYGSLQFGSAGNLVESEKRILILGDGQELTVYIKQGIVDDMAINLSDVFDIDVPFVSVGDDVMVVNSVPHRAQSKPKV
jgi:hypothetical protein